MKYFSFIPAALLVVTTVFRANGAPPEKYQQVQLEGLTITMTLEKRTPILTKADWPTGPISLIPQSVPVNQKTIHELLKAAHIFPDVEAFTMVYALNPDIQALREIKVPQIRIPKLVGGPRLEAAFTSGFVVLLTVEKERKERFSVNVSRLKQLVQEVSKLGPEKFQDPSTRQAVISSLSNTSAILVGINQRITQRFGRPISTEVLSQLNAETQLLNATLSAKAASEARFDVVDQDKVLAIDKDVRRKGRAFSEVAAGAAADRYPTVEVSVKTLRDGRPVRGLRIYFVAVFLKEDEGEVKAFGLLTSDNLAAPAKARIEEGYYCFWGAKDPAKAPVTNEQCQEIWNNPNVELTVIR